jgi:uncharacterized secreted protein with C-terminal beta-propeller domain
MRQLVTTAAAFGAALVLGVGIASIGAPPPDGVRVMPDALLATAELAAFADCDELTTFMSDAAEAVMAGGDVPVVDDLAIEVDAEFDVVVEEQAGAPSAFRGTAEAASEPAAGDAAFSGTNVQEAGVDEPDIVKTDGRLIVTASGGRLHVVDLAAGPSVAGTVDLPGGWGHELLLVGDRALVLTTEMEFIAVDLPDARSLPSPMHDRPQAQAVLVDLAAPAQPEVISTVALEGHYTSARLVDGVARIVLRTWPAVPLDEAEDADAAAWLPAFASDTDTGSLVDCGQVHHPIEPVGVGTVTVLSLPLQAPLAPQGAASVVAEAETVYATADRLYVAWNRWDAEPRVELHAFDITDPAAARYVGAGAVPGQLLNQWALSRHAGHLRVATTTGDAWAGGSESAVTVLAEQAGELVDVGRVDGLGPDERIYAVRYLGDIGFVVTFRETDPLYSLDLSDPTNPRVVGELKIPGFSNYLHPIGDGLLLGVGQDADEQGMPLGLQVSVFDVSDLANPSRLHQLLIGQGDSEAQYDHRAFLWWAPEQLAVVPVWLWSEDPAGPAAEATGGEFSGAVGLRAGRDGLAEATRLTSPGGYGVRRALVVGDVLYTVAENGIASVNLDGFAERAWVEFELGS